MHENEKLKRENIQLRDGLKKAQDRIVELEDELQRLAKGRVHGSTLWHIAKISLKDLPAETISSLSSAKTPVQMTWAYAQRCVDQAMQ